MPLALLSFEKSERLFSFFSSCRSIWFSSTRNWSLVLSYVSLRTKLQLHDFSNVTSPVADWLADRQTKTHSISSWDEMIFLKVCLNFDMAPSRDVSRLQLWRIVILFAKEERCYEQLYSKRYFVLLLKMDYICSVSSSSCSSSVRRSKIFSFAASASSSSDSDR